VAPGDGHHFLLGTPRDEYSLLIESPLSEYRRAKVEQQYGGILTRVRPVLANAMEFLKSLLSVFDWIPVCVKKTR
jgi:hypothetical protein